MFIFRNDFSHSLKNIYGLICLSLCILMHFTFLLSLWHMLSLAYIFFLTFDAIFDSIWHKLYYQHKIWSSKVKKIQDNILWSLEMSARGNFPKMVEITKNLKNCVVCVESQCPKCSQIVLKLINLAILTVEFYKFG